MYNLQEGSTGAEPRRLDLESGYKALGACSRCNDRPVVKDGLCASCVDWQERYDEAPRDPNPLIVTTKMVIGSATAKIVSYEAKVPFTKDGASFEYHFSWSIDGDNSSEDLVEFGHDTFPDAQRDVCEGDDPALDEDERDLLRTAALSAVLGKAGSVDLADE